MESRTHRHIEHETKQRIANAVVRYRRDVVMERERIIRRAFTENLIDTYEKIPKVTDFLAQWVKSDSGEINKLEVTFTIIRN